MSWDLDALDLAHASANMYREQRDKARAALENLHDRVQGLARFENQGMLLHMIQNALRDAGKDV